MYYLQCEICDFLILFVNVILKILVKIPAGLFEIGKIILKCVQKCKGPKIAKTTLKKKNKVGKHTI